MSLSFDNLRKYPFQYLLFVFMSVIAYLYIHDQSTTNKRIDGLTRDNIELKMQVKTLDSLLRNCMEKNELTRIIDSLKRK